MYGKSKLNSSSKLVFPGQNLKTPFDIRRAWRKAIKDSGIEDFRFHDLRHCVASYLTMNGASLRTVAEILGHKSMDMVMRYAHLSQEYQKSAISKMTEKIFSLKS